MNKVIEEFKKFVNVKPTKSNHHALVHHPIFTTSFEYHKTTNEFLDVFKNSQTLLEERLAFVNDKMTIATLTTILRTPYRLDFLKRVKHLTDISFSKHEFDELLINSYKSTEFPNFEHFVQGKSEELLSLFEDASTYFIMNYEDAKMLESMPDEITVYRGSKDMLYDALSWTLSAEVATWFANRFDRQGIVYHARINKKDIFCYNSHEQEIILDYRKLKDIGEL